MKKLITYLTAILFLGSCFRAGDNLSGEIEPLFPVPLTCELNTNEGYAINIITGDSIRPIVNSFGKTVITGDPVPVTGKIIDPDSVAKPVVISSGKPKIVSGNLNVNNIPEKLTVIPVDKNSLKTFTPGVDTSSFVLVNSTGDTIPTGVPFPVKGRIVPCLQPQPVKALPPRMKDIADINIKYLDVEQGTNSSYILAILEDSRGNIWFGNIDGGVSKYDGDTFTHYTEKEGLSNNTVFSILEDNQGNLWFGTSGGGVSKYDGDTFTHYTEKEGLSNNTVLSILEDTQGNLWFGTNGGGVCLYNGANQTEGQASFTHFTKKEGLNNNVVKTILEDSQGNIWFGTNGGGVSMFDGKTFTSFTVNEGLSNNSVMTILLDSNNNLWFGTWGGGVIKYDGATFTNFTTDDGLIHNSINSIVEDRSGNLWFGTWEGVSLYNGKTFTNLTENDGLNYIDVQSILEDSGGNLWFGTWGGGVSVLNNRLFRNFTEKENLNDNHIFSILQDRNSNLWFGSWRGVSKYDGATFTHLTQNEGLCHNYVYSMYEDTKGYLWFGTAEGGVSMYDGESFTSFTDKNGLGNNYVNSIEEDTYGNLWFGTYGGGVSMYDGETFTNFTEREGFINDLVNSVVRDHRGNLWFGTDGGGVSKYDGKTFTNFTEREGLSNNNVLSVMEDSYGNLWFGTDGGGVNMFDGETFTYFTIREGLSDNIIRSIVEDNDKNIWLSTERGVNLLRYPVAGINTENNQDTSDNENSSVPASFADTEIYFFNEMDGLQGMSFYQNSMLLDNKNRLWMGNVKNLTMLDVGNFEITDRPLVVQLNRIEINEQFFDYRNLTANDKNDMKFDSVARFFNYPVNMELPYYQNQLAFYFSATDWSAPYKLRYSYKMEGLNDSWSMPSVETKAVFRGLPSGKYTFKVRVMGEAQKWYETCEYSFSILPPWWKTVWFRSIVIIILLCTGPIIFIWRIRALRDSKIVLEGALEKAKESDRLKTAFLSNMSHEIRTPMNGILGFAELLKDPDLSKEETNYYIQIIQDSGARLLNTINSIIDISKIESGNTSVVIGETNINEKVESVYKFFKREIEKRGLSFLIEKGLPTKESNIKTDSEKVYSVLTNLIKNAIKFTDNGSIEFGYEKKGEYLEFFVRDSGIGIPYGKQKIIFERFRQASESHNRGYEGSGLGLSIAKSYIEMLGGKIWVESVEGLGSVFYFIIPYNPVYKEKEEILNCVPEKLELTQDMKLKILIVEDDEVSYSLLLNILPGANNEILHAITGFQAVEVCRDNPDIDLILMDIRMPMMDGFEATREIRKFNKHVIIIAQTAYALAGDSKIAIDAGCDDYISKPINMTLLFELINKYIKK